ncbi:hypothetical protein [Paenibacillus sp. JJ-223]|uniref:hypothetical protein n=1 Tax=Paenibacillus sp. JJ-223 TaxID=2905647 RepID=UPI001F31CE35|nr:hypothetical protein [Paenibacillus sp. JJ-223]CAH1191029.1 hypothetical protein PAECIP111890_00271 [Paenibacillus sp. JJ-223]
MIKILMILVVAALISWIELPRLIREKERRTAWGFSVLLLIGVGISVAQTLFTDLPTPLAYITMALRPLSRFLTALDLI